MHLMLEYFEEWSRELPIFDAIHLSKSFPLIPYFYFTIVSIYFFSSRFIFNMPKYLYPSELMILRVFCPLDSNITRALLVLQYSINSLRLC